MAKPKAPSCNEKCLSHTMMETGETAKTIRTVLEWNAEFIAGKIRTGSLESVRIPHFGIFRPKIKMIRAKGYGTPVRSTGRQLTDEEI